MADYFPRDILIDIFLRFPMKLVVGYSFVCKLWRDIIKDPLFIAKYSSKSGRDNQKLLFLKSYHPKRNPKPNGVIVDSAVEYIDWPYENIRKFLSSQKEDWPCLKSNDRWCYHIFGLCKSLILLSDFAYESSDKFKFFILNPSLGKFFPLPPIEVHCGYFGGIGFDSVSKDYKVLILSSQVESSHCVISLYSLNTNSWKDISVSAQYPPIANPSHHNPVFFNGYLHWIANNKYKNNTKPNFILRFDVTREVFDTMCLFDNHEVASFYYSIAIVFGKFCYASVSENYCWSIWLMNEYSVAESWTCQFEVDRWQLGDYVYNVMGYRFEILGSRGDDEVLLDCFDKIVSYNRKSDEVKYLASSSRSEATLYIDKFEDSLVLFDRQVPILETPI